MPAVLRVSFSKSGIGTLSLVHPVQAPKGGPDPGNVSSALRSRRKGQDMYFNQVEFGQRIKEERNRMGLTQEELALRLNIGHEHMNKIERGKRGCSIDILLELSELFGVSTDYLLMGKRTADASIRNTVENVMEELSSLLGKIDGRLA